MHPTQNPDPSDPTAGNNEGLVTVTEPMEGAFTIQMPGGWRNQAYLQREHDMNRIIASSVSPDGGTMIYLGDPRIPYFMEPNPYINPQLMAFNPSFRMQPYSPAEGFFQDYLRQFFGRVPGFRVTGTAESPEYQRILAEEARRSGHQTRSTSVCIAFEHNHKGQPMRCVLHGVTSTIGTAWHAELFTVNTTGGDLDRHSGLALRMAASRRLNPAWAEAQRGLQAQRLAMGQQQIDHIHNMTQVQTQGHYQRMQGIQAFGQANTGMHEQRMAQSDAQHQAWTAQSNAQHQGWMEQQSRDDAMQQARVNAIREEHTVVDGSGDTYQVDSHHERYYVNQSDNTYIGTGDTTEVNDLRRTHGVDPDDFEEGKIVR